MNVSRDALRKETVQVFGQIEEGLKVAEQTGMGLDVKAPLLSAKATCLNTLVLLNDPEKRRRDRG